MLEWINVTAFQGNSSPATYIVSVNADSGGLPGAVLEQFTFFLNNTDYFHPVFLTGTSALHPTLSACTQYWLTTDVSSPTTMNVGWPMNNQGSKGLSAWHAGNTPWTQPFGSAPQILGAFSVIGTPIAGPPPTTLADVLRNGVEQPQVSPGIISTHFQPACGSLKEAANFGGYDHFNWVQIITKDDLTDNWYYWPSAVAGGLTYCTPGYIGIGDTWIATDCTNVPKVPFVDPPRGGYANDGAHAFGPPVEDNLDWYWDEVFTLPPLVIADHVTRCTQRESEQYPPGRDCSMGNKDTLAFEDEPKFSIPFIANLLSLEARFSTTLVGVRSDGRGDALNLRACDSHVPLTCKNVPGTSFDWHIVGTTIGVDQRRQNFEPDPGTLVFFDGFKLPGAAGFTQPELELFARNGIQIRDDAGIVKSVIIDIKPGGVPNSINPSSLGVIPVAIVSTAGFHAPDEVDQKSLTFGRTGDESSRASCHTEDVNGDGLMDLVCQFLTPLAGFQSGDTEGILKGKTVSGLSLYGKDSVRLVPAGQ